MTELDRGDVAHERVPPLSIIALDDDPDFREHIADLLGREGHHVRAVSVPEELYAAIEARAPDVVLLDMKMGKHSGTTVLEAVRGRWPKLCVIVVTGFPSMETMRETFKQDVFDYISKPFKAEELRRALGQAARSLGLGGAPHERLRSELGRQIRLTRAQRGWTLRDLSESSGVSVSQLSSIERGAHLPSLESFVAIANALECQPSDWLRNAGF
ncbi:MAG: response regulator [Planctomycetota bacterium]|nr:response regulator [Planctomycetota bacterium]